MKSIVFTIIAVLLAVNNIFIHFKFGLIAYDRLLEFIFFFFFFNSFIKEFTNRPFVKKITIFILAFTVLQLIVNLKLAAFHEMDSELVLVRFFKCISFLVFSFLFFLIANKDLKYINIIIGIHLLICIFALMQHPISPISNQVHELKVTLFSQVENDVDYMSRLDDQKAYIESGISNKFRISGPFATPIMFTYFLITSLFLNLYMYFRTHKRIYSIIILFIFLCSVLTQTRSLVLALFTVLLGVLLWINNKKIMSFKVIITLLGLIVSLIFINKIETVISGKTSRLSSISNNDSRPVLWITGLYAVANYPLGISENQYDSIKKEMAQKFERQSIKNLDSHNGFINIGIMYSIFGYVLIIMFFVFIKKHLKLMDKNFRRLFYLFIIGYCIHMFFHNNIIFISDYDFLMILMLIPIHLAYQNAPINESSMYES